MSECEFDKQEMKYQGKDVKEEILHDFWTEHGEGSQQTKIN